MRFFKFLLWTTLMVGFGIFLSRYKVLGRTPVDHVQKVWHEQATQERVKRAEEKVKDKVQDAKVYLGSAQAPREHHNADERAAVDTLIARRTTKK